jgi:hypothetical protein
MQPMLMFMRHSILPRASLRNASGDYLVHGELETISPVRKEMKRQIRAQLIVTKLTPSNTEIISCKNRLAVRE